MIFCNWLLKLRIIFLRSFWSTCQDFIPSYRYSIFYLPIQLLIGIWAVSSCLLRVMLLKIFMDHFLSGYVFSFLLGIYLRVELLSHVVTLCLPKLTHFRFPLAFYIPTTSLPALAALVITDHHHPFLLLLFFPLFFLFFPLLLLLSLLFSHSSILVSMK